jgi:hypothetical protein
MHLIQFPKMPYVALNFIRTSCDDTGLKVEVCQGGICRGEWSISICGNVKQSWNNERHYHDKERNLRAIIVYFYINKIDLFFY